MQRNEAECRVGLRKRMIPGLAALLMLCTIVMTGCSAQPVEGPILWQEKEPGVNMGVFDDHDAMWTSYRLPPNYKPTGSIYEGGLPLNISPEEIEALQEQGPAAYKNHEKFYFGPNPFAVKQLTKRENALLKGEEVSAADFGDDEFLGQPQKNYLALVVEYDPPGGSQTIERDYPVDPADPSLGCSVQSFTFGSLFLGDDPPPTEGIDNFSFYKADLTLDDYRSAIFGTGPDAGYGVVRPDLGGIDLSGYSLNNYLLEMNPPDAPYTTSGDILPESVILPNAQEYYGAAVYSEDEEGNCVAPTFSDARYGEHIFDVLDAITAKYDGDATIDWSQFDADGDQIVDLLAVIHAGNGFQEGGGEDRLSTSSSGFIEPQQIVGFTTPEDDSDDYFVLGFNINPEQLDVGAVQEEFEHQFGIPDFYSTDLNNSNAWWTSHSSGVWGGELGATRPMGSGLYASWILGRKTPMIYEWNDPALLAYGVETGMEAEKGITLKLGRARATPADAQDGAIIRLPQVEIDIPNQAGDGIGWWSDTGDLLDNRVYRDFDLTGATGQVIFSFDAQWDIEQDWDYGLIQFSIDGGETWEWPQDMDGVLTDQDPNDVGVVEPGMRWGLTGQGEGNLRWDLSDYSGENVTIMIRYLTDVAVANPGYQVDNLLLVDDSGTIYENDLEEDFSDWTNEGWVVVPLAQAFERYYLLEYRVANGFDESLNNPYWINYSADDGPDVRVDRLPATDEVLIVSYRDQSQGFDYTLSDATISGNSLGAKFGHLVVDSHPFPQMWDVLDANRDELVGRNMSGRIMPGDAGFGLNETEAWSASYEFDPETGEATPPNTWDSRPAVAAFHDSYGYTPGLFFSPDTGFVYFWDEGASAVLPTRGVYSTPITDTDGEPLEALYGATVAGFPLGTGNPGDDHVHYGLHVEVLSSTDEYAMVRIWNRPYEAEILATIDVKGKTTFYVEENIGGALEMPYFVVSLPEGATYVADSAFGGFMPVGGETMEEALAAAQSGLRAAQANEVTHLVWTGATIGTGKMAEMGGFEVETADRDAVAYMYDLYREGNSFVQRGSVKPMFDGNQLLFPIIR